MTQSTITSKEDAQKLWTARDEELWKRAAVRIDSAIVAGGRMVVNLSELEINPRVKERIVRACEEGGWSVHWTSGDQRDPGPYLELK